MQEFIGVVDSLEAHRADQIVRTLGSRCAGRVYILQRIVCSSHILISLCRRLGDNPDTLRVVLAEFGLLCDAIQLEFELIALQRAAVENLSGLGHPACTGVVLIREAYGHQQDAVRGVRGVLACDVLTIRIASAHKDLVVQLVVEHIDRDTLDGSVVLNGLGIAAGAVFRVLCDSISEGVLAQCGRGSILDAAVKILPRCLLRGILQVVNRDLLDLLLRLGIGFRGLHRPVTCGSLLAVVRIGIAYLLRLQVVDAVGNLAEVDGRACAGRGLNFLHCIFGHWRIACAGGTRGIRGSNHEREGIAILEAAAVQVLGSRQLHLALQLVHLVGVNRREGGAGGDVALSRFVIGDLHLQHFGTVSKHLHMDGVFLAVVDDAVLGKAAGCLLSIGSRRIFHSVGIYGVSRDNFLHHIEEVALHVLIRLVIYQVADLVLNGAETSQALQMAVRIHGGIANLGVGAGVSRHRNLGLGGVILFHFIKAAIRFIASYAVSLQDELEVVAILPIAAQ